MKSKRNLLIVHYRTLGTMSLPEFRQALLTDMAALQDECNLSYLTAPKLVIPITNEYGEPVALRELVDSPKHFIDSYHYRPACKDFEL